MLTSLILTLLSIMFSAPTPHANVLAPTTRYHGHTLNHKAIEKAKLFTVLISAEGFGPITRGTGILVDRTHVLTCAHVALHSNEELFVYFWPGYMTARAKMVYADSSKDLAILEIDVPVRPDSWPVFETKHYDGEPITIIGNALGSMKWFVGYGIISGENKRDLYTDGLVLGGDSGGPWINEHGDVVALSDWGLQHDERAMGINGGVSARVIKEFLKEWKHPSIFQMLLGG